MDSEDQIAWLWALIIFVGVCYLPFHSLRSSESRLQVFQDAKQRPLQLIASTLLFSGTLSFLAWLVTHGLTPVWPTWLVVPGFALILFEARKKNK